MIALTSENYFQKLDKFNICCSECGSKNIQMLLFPKKLYSTVIIQAGIVFISCKDCGNRQEIGYCDIRKS